MLYRDEPIINEATIDQHLGNDTDRRCGTKPRICAVGSMAFAPQIPADFKVIPREEWRGRIQQMDAEKSRLSDFVLHQRIPCKSQEQTLYCHGNSPAAAIEFLRAMEGQQYVPLSPASIAGPTVGFQNAGGYIADDLKQVTDVGAASEYFVPANQIGEQGFRIGWQQDAANYKAKEWWDLGHRSRYSFDLMMTLLFARVPVCVAYNWWGHAVTMTDPVLMPNGRFGARGRNSWGDQYGAHGFFVVEESYATPDEAYALRSITQSHVTYDGMHVLE